MTDHRSAGSERAPLVPRGIVASIFASLGTFLLLVAAFPTPLMLPDPPPGPDGGGPCELLRLDLASMPRQCVLAEETATALSYQCMPPGGLQEDWTVRFRMRGGTAACSYDFGHFDIVRTETDGDVLRGRRSLGLSSDGLCVPGAGAGSFDCEIAGAPWKAYTVTSRWTAPDGTSGYASRTVNLELYQRSGVNVRWASAGRFVLLLLISTLLMLPVYVLRPGGPRSPRMMARSRPFAVGAMCGWGGMITAAFMALNPPDFGGPDVLTTDRLLVQPALGFLAGAFIGVLLDEVRRLCAALSSLSRLSLIAVVVIAVVVATSTLHVATSAFTVHGPGLTSMKYKAKYYVYFHLAMLLPVVLVWPARWRVNAERLTGAVVPTRSMAATLFVWAILGAALANMVAIWVGDHAAVSNFGALLKGFYKPASAWGLLATSLPGLAAACLAVTMGVERPEWVQDLVRQANGLARDGTVGLGTRAPAGRALLAALVTRRDADLRRHAPQLVGVTLVLPELVKAFCEKDDDVAQLAGELSMDRATLVWRVAAVRGILAEGAFAVRSRRVERPLLFVDADARAHAGGVRVEQIPDPSRPPGGHAVDVWRNGRLVPAGNFLATDVVSLVRRAAILLGMNRNATMAFEQQHVVVELTYPCDGLDREFRGASYQLGVVLAAMELALECAPVAPWAATGRLSGGEDVVGVQHVDKKIGAIEKGHVVYLIPLENANDARPVVDELLEVRTRLSALDARARVRDMVAAGKLVAVAVPNLTVAAVFLFGEALG